jgi:hypothetical protein
LQSIQFALQLCRVSGAATGDFGHGVFNGFVYRSLSERTNEMKLLVVIKLQKKKK